MNLFLRKIHADLYCGFSFFSRLPMAWCYRQDFPFSFARAIWAWPFVAITLGCIEGLLFYSMCQTHLPSLTIALLTIGFHLWLTGALHEDGLADTADGLGGGKNPEHKLTIMRDSRLGSYGVLSLFIILGLQISSLSSLAQIPEKGIYAIIIAAVMSRSSMLIPLLFLNPARSDGMASQLTSIPKGSILLNFGLSILILMICYPWHIGIIYLVIIMIITGLITCITKNQINGYTGDILGATQVLTSTIILILSTLL